MAHSSNSGKEYIRQYLTNIPSNIAGKPVLDIGCGAGKLHALYSGILDGHWTGIEVFTPFIEKWKLTERYNSIVNMNVLDWIIENSHQRYGVVFCGDVLEHMTKEDAKVVLDYARSVSDCVIVSIPIGYYPQDEFEGNIYEIHITDNWTNEDFIQTFGEPSRSVIDNEIGVYVYDNLPKPKLKIAVYAIAKNESAFVEQFVESAKGADYIVIADTGSTDDTVIKAKECGAMVYDISIQPWRFDYARNASLALVPADADICICMDLDEKLQPGWRDIVLGAWNANTTRLRYMFDWSNGVLFQSDKIHARKGYFWKHPCHELLYPRDTNEVWSGTTSLLITHHPDPTKSRSSYLGLLEIGYKEDSKCSRNALYLGREYVFNNKFKEANECLDVYLTLNTTYIAERAYAMRLLSTANQNTEKGLYWLQRAAIEYPQCKESFVYLSQTYYNTQNWEQCYAAAISAIKINKREYFYFDDPTVWAGKAEDLAAISAYNLGLYAEALKYAEIALGYNPDDARLKLNVDFCKSKL